MAGRGGISIIPPIRPGLRTARQRFAQRSFACAIIARVWSNSETDTSIGMRMRTWSNARQTQDGAALREEEARLGETEADRAQTSAGVGRDARQPVQTGFCCRRRDRTCESSPAGEQLPCAT